MAAEAGHHADRPHFRQDDGGFSMNGGPFYADDDSTDISDHLNALATASTALTTQLTTITPADAAGTPDYAIQAVINSSAYGFASAQELISFIYVVRNLQVRVAEIEAILEAKLNVTAN